MKTLRIIILMLLFSAHEMSLAGPVEDIQWSDQYSSPGINLEIRETERRKGKKGSDIVTYSIIASNFPGDTVYHIWFNPLGGKPEKMPIEYIVNESGVMIDKDSSMPLEKNMFQIGKYAKGEPFRVALISADKSVKGFAKTYPWPIEVKGESGCRILVELASPKKDKFMIFLEGFEPNEELTTRTKSDGEVLHVKAKVNQEGRYNVLYLPAVEGSKGGVANYRVTSKLCDLSIEVDWGIGKSKKRRTEPLNDGFWE